MIEGIRFDVGHVELREHLERRHRWHVAEAAVLEKAIDATANNLLQHSRLARFRVHSAAARTFDYLARHVCEDTYRLSLEDLRTLEFVEQPQG